MMQKARDAAKDKRINNPEEAFIDLTEALDLWFPNKMLGVHTCIPGVMENYNRVERRCDVKPAMNFPFPGGTFIEPPVILSCPVLIPGSADYVTEIDIPNGTPCLVQFSEAGIGQWLKGATQPDADGAYRFQLTDAMVTPGLYPYEQVPKITRNGVNQEGDNVTHTAKELHKIVANNIELAAAKGIQSVAADGDNDIQGTSIKLNGDAKPFVTHAELDLALQTFVTALNLVFSTKLDGGGSPGVLVLNIAASATTTVKTGG